MSHGIRDVDIYHATREEKIRPLRMVVVWYVGDDIERRHEDEQSR